MKTHLLILCLLLSSQVRAQAGREMIYPGEVRQFYEILQHKTAWLHNEEALQLLWQYLDSAGNLGLQQRDYQFSFISRFRTGEVQLTTGDDSLMADQRFTDAAIHFFRDVMVGNSGPQISYNGLSYSPGGQPVISYLASALSSGRFAEILKEVEPGTPEYNAIKNKIAELNDTTYTRQHKKSTLNAQRAALNRAINTVRWLNEARQSNELIIVVNIPSGNLLVYHGKGVMLESKVIAGKASNRTPTLCSKIDEVILYPYWMVPKSIATKELLPLIKRDPGFLDANGYQVMNAQGRLVNPRSIKWDSLSAGNFPYTLRQSTGCDNSLGIVKLNFYNPYTVYLHDTPWKSLFNLGRRFLSHGCVRVEKAIELAKLLLKERSPLVDSLIDKGCLPDQEPIVMKVQEKMPVFILYNTAWVDAAATVRFYEDVYRKFPSGKK